VAWPVDSIEVAAVSNPLDSIRLISLFSDSSLRGTCRRQPDADRLSTRDPELAARNEAARFQRSMPDADVLRV